MAEVLGFVSAGAGLLSLAIQLQENALKLKDLCSSIRHADERLKQLIFDLETEALLLRKIESLRQNTDRQDELLHRCIATCRRHASEVEEAASAITAQMQRSARAGKLYWAFKEHNMDKLYAKLDKAKTSLHLASAMFMHQEQELQLLANRNAMTAMTAILTQTITAVKPAGRHALPGNTQLHNSTADTVGLVGAISWRKQQRKPRWRLRFRNWFNSTIWDIAVHHAEGNWSVNLRVQSYRPFDPEVLRLCKHGDVGQLQQLIAEKQISFTDTWSGYWGREPENLLSLAAEYGQIALCKWLLLQTEWPDLLHFLQPWRRAQWADEDHVEAYRVFTESSEADVDLDIDDDDKIWKVFFGPYVSRDCVEIVLRSQTTLHTARPISERLFLGQINALTGTAVDAYLQIIGAGVAYAELATAKTFHGWTALHQVADAFCGSTYSMDWSTLGTHLLKAGADASALGARLYGRHDLTPLLARLTRAGSYAWMTDRPAFYNLDYVIRALNDWSSLLEAADIDLRPFCERENSIWEELGLLKDDFDPTLRCYDLDLGHHSRIDHSFYPARLSFGPTEAEIELLSLECRSYALLQVFELQSPPGAYPRHSQVPTIIPWIPRNVDQAEGPWSRVSWSHLRGEPFDARARRHEEEKQEVPLSRERLVNSAQDDASFAILAERRSSLRVSSRRRSASVYAARAKFGKDIWPEGVFKWLPEHLRLGLWNDTAQTVSAPEGGAWYQWSFLSQIRCCQEDLLHRSSSPGKMIYECKPAHTPGEAECPWGCHRVNLSKLNVPDSCWNWHPERVY